MSNPISLSFLDSYSIKYEDKGLLEPSGLCLSDDKQTLWTISDDTNKIFALTLSGKLLPEQSFTINDKELEGITLVSKHQLAVVKETGNVIILYDYQSQKEINRKALADMASYDLIAQYFSKSNSNKGLEGITWNTKTSTFFVLKEANPGLLIEISADLQSILSVQILDDDKGFRDKNLRPKDIDYSDVCYDSDRDCFWIISDQASRLFLYHYRQQQVIQSTALAYTKKDKNKKIKKAEGITINNETNRLYIVSDTKAKLYVFDINI